MPVFRRKRTYRRKSTLKRLTKPRKTTAIQTLAKQVMAIKRSMKQERQIVNYQQTAGDDIGQQIAHDLTWINLSQLSNWSAIFGASADDEENPSAIWKSFGLDVRFTSYNEPSEVNFTVFIVRAKDSFAPYINLLTGAAVFTAGTHYVNSSATGGQVAAGLVMLNKKYFDILKIKRFTLSNHGTTLAQPSAQTQYGTDMRMYFKHSPNLRISNPSGNWKATPMPQDPSSCYFMLVFNNNLSADAENPRMFYNVVHTVQV